MSLTAAGKVICDRCGGDCGNGGIHEAVTATYLNTDGEPVNVHFCLRSDETHERCATRILTKASLAALLHGEAPEIHAPSDGPA